LLLPLFAHFALLVFTLATEKQSRSATVSSTTAQRRHRHAIA
jgi:hypothetical protein